MGQKVNPIVFRLNSKIAESKSQYYGKNMEEFSYYLYQDIEIKKYLTQIFESNGMILQYCVIKRSNLKINIYVNFYVTSKISVKLLSSFSNILALKFFINKKSLNFNKFFKTIAFKSKIKKTILRDDSLNSEPFKFLPDEYLAVTKKKSNYISIFKKKIIESLLQFTGVSKVSLNLNNLQNNSILKVINRAELKSKIQELSIYSKERFFKEAVEILILVFTNKESSKLLSKFIAFQFQIMKRHNTFLTFLKRSLFIFNTIKFASIQGVKILINGRFNGVPRAKGRIIQNGRLPLQSLNSKINYHNTEAQTPYGTFGIKVWVCEK